MTAHDPVALGVRAALDTIARIDGAPAWTPRVIEGGRRADAVVPGRAQAVAVGHPSVFDDRSEDPDWVGLPHVTERALRVLVAAAAATGNPVMVGHAREVSDHFGLAAFDDANPHGMPRPS
jgi:hypothetical protein